ncbi:protein FAM179B [Arapaima gigas]
MTRSSNDLENLNTPVRYPRLLTRTSKPPAEMIFGLLPKEIHKQLLDQKSYQNRTNGVEELKCVLLSMDMWTVPVDNMKQFITFLCRLLDDTNFKVFLGSLQVINILVQKLDQNVEKHVKQLMAAVMKTLGDTRPIARIEYMSIFHHLMKIIGPQKVLDLVMGQLKHEKSRVREDVINIITAGMLTHPRKEFDVCNLCYEVAPCLADSNRRVRHAALELFSLLDFALDTGEKQSLVNAIDLMKLHKEGDGLMAAIKARRARRMLPKLTSDGMVEYALVLPKPGERVSASLCSGPDLDWVLNGSRVSSGRNQQMESSGSNRLYGSLGSLSDVLPLQRRIASARKSTLPWPSSNPPSAVKSQAAVNTENKSSEQVSSENHQPHNPEFSQEPHISNSENCQLQMKGRKEPMRQNISNPDLQVLESASPSDRERVLPKLGRPLSGYCSVENTISMLANSTPPGWQLLPSYPLATVSGNPNNSVLPQHYAKNALCMSNTWPNKRESSPCCRDDSPRRLRCALPGNFYNKYSPLPSRGSLVRSSSFDSSSCYHQGSLRPLEHTTQGSKEQLDEQGLCLHGSRDSLQRSLVARDTDLDISQMGKLDQQEEVVDREEMMNSLRSLRFSAAKKRAKISLSSSDRDPNVDLDSPDSAVKLESPLHTPSSVNSPLSESGLSSLCSPSKGNFMGTTDSFKVLSSSAKAKPRTQRVSSTRMCVTASLDYAQLAECQMDANDFVMEKAESTRGDLPVRPSSSQELISAQCHNSVHHIQSSSDQSPPLHKPIPPLQPKPPNKSPKARLTRMAHLRRATILIKASNGLSNSSDDSSGKLSQRPNLQPFPNPEQALTQSLDLISISDWEKKIEGLNALRGLAQFHPNMVVTRLHDVCLAIIKEMKNLRTGVSRAALGTMGDLYVYLHNSMDQELDWTASMLLEKACHSNVFIRQEVDTALDSMVENCTPVRVMNALLNGGLNHVNSAIRRCTAQHLADTVEKMGADSVLSGSRDVTGRILPAVVKLAQDSAQDARHYGRRILLFLASHPEFYKMLEKYIPTKEVPYVRDTMLNLKTKGLADAPIAGHNCLLNGSKPVRDSSLSREPVSLKKCPRERSCKGLEYNIAEKAEYIKQMKALMVSKDFRDRIQALDQLVTDCRDNRDMVIASMFPVFDSIKARLQESNSKVNLHALQALQKVIILMKDNLAPVVSILVPAIIDHHLNSSNNAIYSAASAVIHALMENIDNTLLLQPFCSKAQFLSGKAKVDLIEKVADLVTELYPYKPQVVERRALPLLWHLLGTSTNGSSAIRVATVTLCQALHRQMGSGLAECALSQDPNIYNGLITVIKNLPCP